MSRYANWGTGGDLVNGSYDAASIVHVAAPIVTYLTKPTDKAILINAASYDAAGPTIDLTTPQDDWPILIRNTAGTLAAHNVTVNAPSGCTIEDPASLGTFSPSITLNEQFESGLWFFDRVTLQFTLFPSGGGAAGTAPTLRVSEFTNNGATVVPAGVLAITMDVAPNGGGGGGGAAGNAPAASQAGGGAGGGGIRKSAIATVVPGETLTIAGIGTSAGGAGGNPGGSGAGGNGAAATDITITGSISGLLGRFVGGSGGFGAILDQSTQVLTPGGQSVNDNAISLPIGLVSLGTPAALLGGPGWGGVGGEFANPGGLHAGTAGSQGFNTNLTQAAGSAPAPGGAAGTSAGGASGGSGGGGGGTGGFDIGGAGGAGGTGNGVAGTAGANAPVNSGGGGGGGGAGTGSDGGGGFGGAGGLGAAGRVRIGLVR
jgi:hypothetical protein